MRSLSHHDGPATILQHKSAPVKFDFPMTQDSIDRAKADCQKERAEYDRLVQLVEDDKLELSAIVDRNGWRRVSDWLMALQAIHQDVRRV